jgi:hypothetical protein
VLAQSPPDKEITLTVKGLQPRLSSSLLAILLSLFCASSVLAGDASLPRNIVALDAGHTINPADTRNPGTPDHLRRAWEQRLDQEFQEQTRRAIEAQERHTVAVMREPGVVGTAVGWSAADSPVIKVFTDRTFSGKGVPARLDGIPVVVEEVGRIFALNVGCEARGNCVPEVEAASGEPATPREYHPRPVPIGVSIGHPDVTAGTLGCRVSNGCHTYILSNAHVIANENAGVIGDDTLQPGVFDAQPEDPDSTIGELSAYIPIVMSTLPSTQNRVDAAIAVVSPADVGTATRTDGGYGEPLTETIDPSVGLDVMKYGRSTEMRYGYIDSINAIVNVNYNEGTARFVGQIIIRSAGTFSRSGDSGALVVGSGAGVNRKPVGLLFASGTDGNGDDITVANPIEDVLTELGVQIDGEAP